MPVVRTSRFVAKVTKTPYRGKTSAKKVDAATCDGNSSCNHSSG